MIRAFWSRIRRDFARSRGVFASQVECSQPPWVYVAVVILLLLTISAAGYVARPHIAGYAVAHTVLLLIILPYVIVYRDCLFSIPRLRPRAIGRIILVGVLCASPCCAYHLYRFDALRFRIGTLYARQDLLDSMSERLNTIEDADSRREILETIEMLDPCHDISRFHARLVGKYGTDETTVTIVSILRTLLGPIFEEILAFLVVNKLSRHLHFVLGFLLWCAVFTLWHVPAIVQLEGSVVILASSVSFACARFIGRSWLAAVVAHSVNNVFASFGGWYVAALYFECSG